MIVILLGVCVYVCMCMCVYVVCRSIDIRMCVYVNVLIQLAGHMCGALCWYV
jgi:hypothetical protein